MRFIVQEYGSISVSLSGKEIMGYVKSVRLDLTELRIDSSLKGISECITSEDMNMKKIERTLITSFLSVFLAIDGFIQNSISPENLSEIDISSKFGWTYGFSDTQRYKMMGNAVTVNVIRAISESINNAEYVDFEYEPIEEKK